MRRLLGLALLAAFAAGALLVWPTDQALGSHVQCGDTITQDTTLDSSVICRDGPGPGDAIVIGADNITLDLNGHTARGSCWEEFGSGVLNVGHSGVTIKNGTLGAYGTSQGPGFFGVRLADADDNTLHNLEGDSCVEGPGFALFRSNGNRISEVTATTYRGWGISLRQSSHNVVSRSAFGGNNVGIALEQSSGNNITQNRLGNVVGISLDGSDQNRLIGNTVAGVADHRCRCALGVWLTRSDANLIKDNTISDTASAEGLLVGDSDGNRVVHNYFTDNGTPYDSGIWGDPARDGLLVDSASDGTELKHNTVLRSGEDGIDIRNPSTTLIMNRANENGDFGIEAVPGTRAHGNKAFGNGNPLQCLNVVCR